MHWLDWTIVAVYLVYMIYDGLRMTKGSENVEGYFLANRSLPWWAVGLSVMATQLSAITLVGTTGQAYSDGMRFIQFYFGLPVAMVILCVTVVPFFYRAKVYTAYEYLEKRFDAKTRSLASFCFLLSRGLSCGVIVAAPSVILSIVLGWNEVTTILVMGASTTIYTMFGGVQAVTWTDVKQMVIVFVGMSVCLGVIISQFPTGVSVGDALALAGATGRLKTVDAGFHLNETYTLWSGLIGGMFLALSYFGCDQSQVQRFLTAKSVSEGRVSILMSAFIKIPMQFLILFVGVMVFVFYQFKDPPMIFKADDRVRVEQSEKGAEYKALTSEYEVALAARHRAATAVAVTPEDEQATSSYLAANAAVTEVRSRGVKLVELVTQKRFSDVNYVFPTFVTTYMPVGVAGLIIAAIFAAAMSSIAAELNSLSTATVIDFYRRHFKPGASDQHYLAVSKLATGFWGIFACVVALYATRLGSFIEVVNRFGSFFYGSLLGVFVLAIGTKRATGRGAFWGLIAGVIAVGIVARYTEISFLWHNLVGCGVVVTVGMLLSLTTSSNSAEARGTEEG
ncbi:MAG: sodium:solute symporter [Acidobacteriota bacterium]